MGSNTSLPLPINTQIVLQSGIFKEQDESFLRRKYNIPTYYNNQIWFAPAGTYTLGQQVFINANPQAILLCMQSRSGPDHFLSQAGFNFIVGYNKGCRCFIGTATEMGPNQVELIDYVTAEEMVKRLNGCTPFNGKWGPCFTIDSHLFPLFGPGADEPFRRNCDM